MADRVRMTCDACGYTCTPQWMNDAAHCLKCQAVLMTRQGCQEGSGEFIDRAQVQMEGKRAPGEASTYKHAASSAMESKSGVCDKSPDGQHNWKFGKCSYCRKGEGSLAKGPGAMINPGGSSDCAKGGKCVFKFAACTKCGRGEGGVAAGGRRPVASSPAVAPAVSKPVFSSGEVGRAGATGGGYAARPAPAPAQPAPAPAGESERRPSAQDFGRDLLGAVLSGQPLPGGYTGGDAAPRAPMPGAGAATSEDRVKMVCHACGYKSFPQWLNDQASCLKCQAVLRTKTSCQNAGEDWSANPAQLQNSNATRRAPGEASTYKQSPGSAMESKSGNCPKSPDGQHNWKFGMCSYCKKAEGKLAKGPGVAANPGGAGDCGKGGKCTFKFSRCSKCGRSEF